MKNIIKKYDKSYISKILDFLNEKINGYTSARALSLLMGLNRNYLSDKKQKEGKYDQYTKFFGLATNLLLLDFDSLNFKSSSHYNEFREKSIKIIFQEMVRKGIYSKDETLSIQMIQFRALVYTLYAINKAMKNKFSKMSLDELKSGKTKEFLYTWNKLSLEIGGVETLSQTIKYELIITPEKIALIKSILEKDKLFALDDSMFAIDLIGEIPGIRYIDSAAYVGSISHPILESFFREKWKNMGFYSRHEVEFNKPISNHRIDSLLEIQSQKEIKRLLEPSINIDLGEYEEIFVDYTIPSLNSLKQSGGVLDKLSPNKYYLTKNRILYIVFYGHYNIKVFKTLQNIIDSTKIPYKNDAIFIDLIDFAKLFNIDKKGIQKLENINLLIKKAFIGNEYSLKALEELSDKSLQDLSKKLIMKNENI